jgi:hypothetical protein
MSLKKSRFIKGIILAPDTLSLDGIEGEIKVDSSTGKIQVTLKDGANPSASREIVTSSQTQTLTNKTLTSPVIDTGVSGTAIETDLSVSASATKLASASAIKTYVDNVASAQNEASEISYSNATSGLTATNVQNAIDEVDGNVDNLVTLSGVALDSTTLGTFTGVTIPDSSTVKSALQAIETSHESHTVASSGVHGVAGSVVGTSDSQALTNKTIDADLNTISNIENADIKVGANIARSKLASGTANRVVVNDATGVQTDAAAITAARVLISDANGIPTHSSVTSTTLSYVDATSSIQNQLDAKVDESGGTLTNGSVITPARLDVKQNTKANLTTYALTAANGQLCFATDTKEMFQIVDGLLESVGGGAGIGGVDILFSQTFEEAALTDFTQTGLSLSTSSPLHGEISALLTHDSSINQLFKQTIPVDIKFRGQTMVLRLDSKSSASQGNVVINIKDETNNANLVASEQLQLSNDVNGKKTSVSFTIPETCASLSYTITALPESGSPTTRIDDIICELAETALLETAVVVPVVTAWQGYTPTFQGFGTAPTGPTNIEFEWRQVGESVEIRGNFTSGSSTGVEARIGLPAGLTSAGTSLIPSIQYAGKSVRDNSTVNVVKTNIILIEPSVTYVTIGQDDYAGNSSPFTKLNASSIVSNGQKFSFAASVPCSGLSATTTKTIPLTQSGLVQNSDSVFRIDGALGYGSTGTSTLRFNTANIRESRGSDISYISSSVNGDSFVVTSSGIYSISADAVLSNGSTSLGITKNSSSTSTLITTIATNNPQQVLTISTDVDTNYSNVENVSWSGYLEAGDIIRVQTSGVAIGSAALFRFSMSKQSSLKQVSVSSDQKITIPTSELRFEGASSRGSTATAIVRFDNIAKLRGDAFTVESDAVLGTRITMKKAGRLSINGIVFGSAVDNALYLTKNQAVLTAAPTLASEILSTGYNVSVRSMAQVNWQGDVAVGDVFRLATPNLITASTSNMLNLSFQEQDIAVSVTNTLPQFSESDSSVRVDTANGYGSTGTKIRRFSNVRDNVGTDIVYADSATDGASFTIKTDGVYSITYSASQDGINQYIGISKNSSQLTTDIVSINASDRLAQEFCGDVAGLDASCSWIGYLLAGDVIRPHTHGVVNSTRAARENFTISKVGKPNVTGVNVTPFVNVPQPESQEIRFRNAANGFGSSYTSARRFTSPYINTNNGIIQHVQDSVTGDYILVLKKCELKMSYSGGYSSTLNPSALFTLNQSAANPVTAEFLSVTQNAANFNLGTDATSILNVGDKVRVCITSPGTFNSSNEIVSFVASALSDQILTPSESFSTDTASLTYAGSASYTLSTLQNAPVGTFITFTYAANTNTRTQTVNTAPTQFASGSGDANTNGIQIFTRAYNATSSAAQPAAIAIQIGKGLKGRSLDFYKSAGKVIAGSLDAQYVSTNVTTGVEIKDYNEVTGILLVDAGYKANSSITSPTFLFSDVSGQTSGYLVINASKSPALTGVPLLQPRIATLSDVKASGTAGGTATSGSYQTRTLNTLDDPTGIVTSLASNQFTLPAGEYYIEASAPAYKIDGNKIKLRNITDSTDALVGNIAYGGSGVETQSLALLAGKLTISSSKVFELQHRVITSKTTDGFGISLAFGDNNIYSIVKITKVK